VIWCSAVCSPSCSVLVIIGLFLRSGASGLVAIFAAATIYGVGKTFFWPTMIAVVSEQTPKGGALTMNAIAGIGMLTVGILGGPLIGNMQEGSVQTSIEKELPGTYSRISRGGTYFLGAYKAVDEAKVKELPAEQAEKVGTIAKHAKQGALAKVTVFPDFMLLCYLGLIVYFRSKGGYKPVNLDAAH
jgi:hypothetical protein